MKNLVKTAIVSAAAAAFVASVAVAGGQGPGQGPGGRGGFGPGFGRGPGGPGSMFGMVQDLTEPQRQQIRAIMEEHWEQDAPVDQQLRRQLHAELLADTPNEQKIEELRQQIIAATGDQLTRHIAVQKRVAQVFTAEQRAKARARIGQDDGRPRRGRGLR
jgi:Spy/CpxP family protein refolding chaperone